jgi:hypothetical protein
MLVSSPSSATNATSVLGSLTRLGRIRDLPGEIVAMNRRVNQPSRETNSDNGRGSGFDPKVRKSITALPLKVRIPRDPSEVKGYSWRVV